MNNRIIGDKGEDLARTYLDNKGYKIVASNYQIRSGEIDIIAYDKDVLVFVEVKTRKSNNYGYAYEAVDYKKQEKIINTSLDYMNKNRLNDIQMRYDIIEVYLKKSIEINHIENAFILE